MPGQRSNRLPAGQGFSVGSLGAGGKPMQEAAEIIAAQARTIAGRWSKRIPPSIKVTVSADGQSAEITAGGPEAPMAFTFEAPGGRWVSHPVFGRPGQARKEWTWVKQVPRPFLSAAADQAATKAADAWGDAAITGWAKAHGFR
jgi:hypothetical protein